jgi:Aldo/keto reductase family
MNSPVINAAAAGTLELGDLTVNRMGFGAMRLPGRLPSGEIVPADRSRSIEVPRRAVELGVNHIDTAAFYFSPLRPANELTAAALAPYPDDLVIVTKAGPGRDPWGEWYSAGPDQLRGQVEEDLRQLGRDYSDTRAGPAGVDAAPRAERAGHPRHRRPRPPRGERRRGRTPLHPGGSVPPRMTAWHSTRGWPSASAACSRRPA